MTRVVCFIPSITETLIDCGVEVVGRTRFCIHPKEKVKYIKVVGGTKDAKWDKLDKLKPDLVILDKEENTLAMADQCPYPYFALHITDLNNISSELFRLAEKLENEQLISVASDWQQVAETNNLVRENIDQIPGAINHLADNNAPTVQTNHRAIKYIDYMIWKDPWMAIGPDTFIWSVLCKLGFEEFLIHRNEKYPNIDAEEIPRKNCYYLFSSEPFPFGKHIEALKELKFQGAVIDGEFYSWYGTRSLRFLQQQLQLN